jgi:hypothetical protein
MKSLLVLFVLQTSLASDLTSLEQATSNGKKFHDEIIKQEREIKEAKKYAKIGFRPRQCPIYSDKYSDLQSKLSGILNILSKDEDCNKMIGGAIENIKADIDRLNKFYDEKTKETLERALLVDKARGVETPDTDPTELKRREAQKNLSQLDKTRQMSVVQTSLAKISSLAQYSVCRKAVNASEVMSLMSDMVVGGSNLGLMVPNVVGTGVALGGQALGALLKTISVLLMDNWDFRKESDRVSFIKLNCSFFQLKSDMDDVGILEIKTIEHTNEISRIEGQISLVNKEIYKIQEELDKANKEYLLKNFTLVAQSLVGENKDYKLAENIALYVLLGEIDSYLIKHTLTKKALTDLETQAEILTKLYNYYEKVIETINSDGINLGLVGKHIRLAEIKGKYANVTLIGNAKNPFELWTRILKSPPVIYATKIIDDKEVKQTMPAYEYFVRHFFNPIEWIYRYQRGLIAKRRFRNASKRLVHLRAIKVLYALKSINNKFYSRLSDLRAIQEGAIFSDADDGTHIKANIISGFKTIDKQIFGKLGNMFLTYVTKRANKAIKNYQSLWKAAKQKIINAKMNHSQMACPDANNITVEYHLAESFSNVAYDYIGTNGDAFHDPNKYLKYIRWKPDWQQREILKQITSLRYYREVYHQQQIISPNDENIFKGLTYHSIGSLMFRLKQDKNFIITIEEYIEKQRCRKQVGSSLDLPF